MFEGHLFEDFCWFFTFIAIASIVCGEDELGRKGQERVKETSHACPLPSFGSIMLVFFLSLLVCKGQP
ncbi:hypothetical protein L6452_34940 [Arctium lappa]|uniref:Uncharacterized protein n=1 Tax=Arctium lappa TaxID=4217 RepID=A0ACB8YK42_ARCLA|nr:hypothetical protein L6452_34940 [Arctium lappa]